MRQAILNKVNDFSEKMLLHYAAPNQSLVVEILQFNAANLASLHDDKLSQYVLVLGQYLVMLQHNENVKNIEYLLLSKTFEHKLHKEKFENSENAGKTEKERRAWVLMTSPELREDQENLLVAEAEKMLIAGMMKAVDGLLNALKKEKSSRRPE